MIRSVAVFVAAALLASSVPSPVLADRDDGTPGAAGIGDPYFPLAGNGGYDVAHYDLAVRYDPETDQLDGTATIRAKALHDLSQFNLDLDGLTVRSISIDGRAARWTRDGGELTVLPRRALRARRSFTVVVRYGGIPEPVADILGVSGFLHTDDGTLVAGQPKVASSWYPVNDHPLDTASYRFRITVPDGLEAMANGRLLGTSSRRGWTTWNWSAVEPMASYLTTMTVGEFDVRSYRAGGIRYWDAIDPDLFAPIATPRTGDRMALSLQADSAYKRLTRTISVPVGDTTLTFWVDRDTEFGFDFFAVEARTPGGDDWTTLPEQSGLTTPDPWFACPGWFTDHPFLTHYQTDNGDGTCTSTGTSGSWNAATGASDGYEQWTIDLAAWAGSDVEISLSSVSDVTVQLGGVTIDDIDAPGTAADTGFEDDGDVLDGWTTPGAPEGSPGNLNDWIAGTSADGPAPVGVVVDAAFARQPEVIDFLAGFFGPYPFSTAGGIVDDVEGLGFALENQTRPIYSRDFFGSAESAMSVIVHEYAHQWFGDDLPLASWNEIWLNEGFATYAEWLWSEYEGGATPQDFFDFYTTVIPPDDAFWALTIGDPGPEQLFDQPVYLRGGMTLHALRTAIGDDAFFELLRTWAATKAGRNVTTPEFVALAEQISGQDLDALFETWLYTPGKPEVAAPVAAVARAAAVAAPTAGTVLAQARRLGLA